MIKQENESQVRLNMTDTTSDTADQATAEPLPVTETPTSVGIGRRAGGRSKGESPIRKPGKTFGQVIRRARQEVHLTQRALAEKIGVKPAHIAYLELDRRRPSLPLLARIADVLGLGREMLINLSHPEAKQFMSKHKEAAPIAKEHAWKQFKGNQQMLARHQVTGNELKVLQQVNLLGKISAPRNFMFILNSIRQAQDEEKD
jgi:transcriptional regulator with XRE-family HTH domain